MKNLKLINLNVLNFTEDASFICTDNDCGATFIVNQKTVFKVDDAKLVEVVPLVLSSDIIFAEFLFEKGAICIVTVGGELYLVDIHLKESKLVGYVEDGILCVSFSPDQELLVIITGSENLILMTKEFDPLSEVYINTDDFGENKPITAGWGSKETQFQGSIGKSAAKIQKPSVQPVFAWDDKKPKISWRGDGQMFVTSSVDKTKDFRQLRIWERCGTLSCTSEDLNGLEDLVSWRPSGNIIASIQRSPNKHEVVFFEKNGLRHGEFRLPFKPEEFQVKGLTWNSASTVLCIWGCNLSVKDSSSGFQIMLWTSSNYHWYLKQTLQFNETILTNVVWDAVEPYLLRITNNKRDLFECTWCWTTNHSIGATSDLVAVIQGSDVYVTPFNDVIIPPPMYGYSLKLPYAANHVVFGPKSNPNDIIIVSTDRKLNIFKIDDSITESKSDKCNVILGVVGGNGSKVQIKTPKYFGTISISWDKAIEGFPLNPIHWIWVNPNKLLCIVNDLNGCHLYRIILEMEKLEGKSEKCQSFQQHVLALHAVNENIVAIELADGTLLNYDPETDILSLWLIKNDKPLKLGQPCSQISSCEISNQHRIIGLSHRNQLLLDDKTIASNCTSFSLHANFLLLTTHTHTLRCLSFNYDLKKVLEDKTLEELEDAPRSLERGSRLVLVIPNSTKVILQMPRGNLESIHPRALVLDVVCSHLDRMEFKNAFEIMRKHRINLNLIFDHNPEAFLENCEKFVLDMETAANVNLFISELIEDDVSHKMYSACYRGTTLPTLRQKTSFTKVDGICNVVRKELEKQDKNKFLLSILTSYAKKTIPELDFALLKIKEVKDLGGDENKSISSEALQYLMYLVDVNRLYDVALGTYDFDLVLMVAEKSQKDPKEFLPFLNQLKLLETNYQKFKIDLHLRRYKKAIKHAVHCGEEHFQECLNLINDQRLYKEALHLFPFESDQNLEIWHAYGDYLMQKKHYEEAGVVFYRAKIYSEALDAFLKVGNWQLALCVATELDYTEVQKAQLSKTLAEYLRGNGHFFAAANLYEIYVHDPEESIATLIEGQLWNTALTQISKHKRPDLIETHLKPSLEEQISIASSVISETKEAFLKYSRRLVIVKEMKLKNEEFNDNEGLDGPDNDMFSDISSVAAFSERSISSRTGSIQTRKSSKSRQKQEKKKYTLKEGSANEDLALLTALTELIVTTENMRDSVASLLQILVIFDFEREARNVQMALFEMQTIIKKSIPEIWPPEIPNAEVSLELGPLATANDIALAMRNQKSQRTFITDPALRNPPKFRMDEEWKLIMLDK